MKSKPIVTAAVALFFASALASQLESAPAAAPSKKPSAKTHTVALQDNGERVFQQHCSRCHTAPDAFSPRISGTIVRHMRVRASLSQQEEEELLRFLNP